MIEITAKLIRAESGMYATGEKVECLVEFTHKSNATPKKKPSNSASARDSPENLAWASVQLHCYRKTTSIEKKSDNAIPELTESFKKTALDAGTGTQISGDAIITTKPKILFCDLKLEPGECKTYFFAETIPRDGPPTYRGHDIKYFYKITIATQRVKSKVQTLTLPIRVLPIPIAVRPDDIPENDTNDELTPTNPFLEKREITELEMSWHHLKNVTARRLPKFYRITNKRGYVGRFCLFKASYKIGEDIVGSLDFSDSEVRCVQFSVKLQSEEIILKSSNTQGKKTEIENSTSSEAIDGASGVGDAQREAVKPPAPPVVSDATGKLTTYTSCHEVCLSMLQTQVIIPIPLHVTPSFTTDLVEVRWRMHFEFVTSTMMDFGDPNSNGEWTAPSEIPVETMIWNLPITIYTGNPLQIYNPTGEVSLVIK